MTKEDDTQILLRKLGTVTSADELRGFEYGLRKYRSKPPSEKVLRAVARRKAQIERMQGNGRKV